MIMSFHTQRTNHGQSKTTPANPPTDRPPIRGREVVMAEIPCVSVVIMQSTTVKTRAENSELLLKNFTIPGKSVAMPADSDRPLQAAIVRPARYVRDT